MRFSLLRTLGYFVGGLWTAWGGRKRIEARQFRRLRRLVEKVRQDSPLFRKLYSDLRESSLIELHDLPVTRKPDLMRDFDDWLTIRSLPLARGPMPTKPTIAANTNVGIRMTKPWDSRVVSEILNAKRVAAGRAIPKSAKIS